MRCWSDHNENIERNKKKVTSRFQNLIGEKRKDAMQKYGDTEH